MYFQGPFFFFSRGLSVFTDHCQEHLLTFSIRFCPYESNTISDLWFSQSKIVLLSNASELIKNKHKLNQSVENAYVAFVKGVEKK